MYFPTGSEENQDETTTVPASLQKLNSPFAEFGVQPLPYPRLGLNGIPPTDKPMGLNQAGSIATGQPDTTPKLSFAQRLAALGQNPFSGAFSSNNQDAEGAPKMGIGQRIMSGIGQQSGAPAGARLTLLPNATPQMWSSRPQPLPNLNPSQPFRLEPLSAKPSTTGFNNGQRYGEFFSGFVPAGGRVGSREPSVSSTDAGNGLVGPNQSVSSPASSTPSSTSQRSAVNKASAAQNSSGPYANAGKENPPKNGPGLNQHGYIPASPEDIAQGNYIKVGFRHVQKGPKIPYHSYVQIPILGPDGKPTGQFEQWGVLGENHSSKNQQVRNDPQNDQLPGYEGPEILVKVTPEQREALRQRMQYFSEQDPKTKQFLHSCPVCGSNYHRLKQNSNTFVYNMLFWNPAGMIWAPKPPRWTVKYGVNLGEPGWYK